MNTPSPPAAPDPTTTATAQTGENISTAIANADLSHVDQTNPYGDTTNWSQNGSTTYTDPVSGTTYQIPTYSESTQLSAPQQQLFNTAQSAEQGAANTANSLINQAQSTLSNPIDLSSGNINNFINTQWEQPFNQQWNQQQEQTQQQLADQGININDPAYATAMNNFTQQRQNAQDTYDTSMYGQGLNALTTQYNQPVNELSALLGSSQVASPSFSSTPQTTIPTTDYAGIVNSGYQNQLAGYNAQNAANSANMGGLFGLGGALISGLF